MRRSGLTRLATVAACLGAAALWPSAALADWVHVANEDQVVHTADSPWRWDTEVRYGAQGHYTTKIVATGEDVPCTNASFGGDPAPGVRKYCDMHGYYSKLADEGEPLPGPTITGAGLGPRVAYGQTNSGIRWFGNLVIDQWAMPPDEAYGNWIIKHVGPGGVTCGNDFFGDPWQGIVKHCYGVRLTYH